MLLIPCNLYNWQKWFFDVHKILWVFVSRLTFLSFSTSFSIYVCLYAWFYYCLSSCVFCSWLMFHSKYFFFVVPAVLASFTTYILPWAVWLVQTLPAVKTSFPALNRPWNSTPSACVWFALGWTNHVVINWRVCELDLNSFSALVLEIWFVW